MITTADVRDAADILRPVHEATGGRDGRVSIEVDPRLAHRTEPTIAEAKQLAWLISLSGFVVFAAEPPLSRWWSLAVGVLS